MFNIALLKTNKQNKNCRWLNMIFESRLAQFLPQIKQLDKKASLQKQDLLNETFLLEKEGKLELYYAPHNEYINTDSKIVIVGITPGWSQMKAAYNCIIQSVKMQEETRELLQNSKIAASFSGQMRKNLC